MRARRDGDGPIQAAEMPGRKGAWKAAMALVDKCGEVPAMN